MLDPRTYFRTLGDLLQAVEVTDREGWGLSVEEGYQRALGLVMGLREGGRKMLVVGNGGSAAIASHMHTDLSNSVGLRSMVFDSNPMTTALSNDFGYGAVYERPIRQWGEAGDLLLAISSSGQSENILRAARAAAEAGLSVLTFSGFKSDNPLRRSGDVNFYVPASSYGFVELAHGVLAHALTDGATAAMKAADKETA